MKIIGKLIQFDIKDENGKYYTIDNIPDDILLKEFEYYVNHISFSRDCSSDYPDNYFSEYYPITDAFEERCSRLNLSHLQYTKDCKGYLIVYNCRELLHNYESRLYIPGNYVTLNDIVNSYCSKIQIQFYPVSIFVKPLIDEVKNYLKLN